MWIGSVKLSTLEQIKKLSMKIMIGSNMVNVTKRALTGKHMPNAPNMAFYYAL